jgi:glycosyltransferase involved in cell wall biosynthesis
MSQSKAKLSLTVVMPALNEERNITDAIESTLAGMDEYGIEGEILVVNDGSTDATGEKIARCMERDARVREVRHETPKGIGFSFWDGVDRSHMDAVVMLPGDNENIPEEIFRYYDLLEHVDMVIPFLFNREKRSIVRNAISYAYRFIINTSFFVNLNYTNGTVLYRRSLLLEMPSRSSGFFFQTEILITAIKMGYLFAEVPYRISTRAGGKSTAVKFPSFVGVVKGYLALMREVWLGKRPELNKHFSNDSATCIRRRQP